MAGKRGTKGKQKGTQKSGRKMKQSAGAEEENEVEEVVEESSQDVASMFDLAESSLEEPASFVFEPSQPLEESQAEEPAPSHHSENQGKAPPSPTVETQPSASPSTILVSTPPPSEINEGKEASSSPPDLTEPTLFRQVCSSLFLSCPIQPSQTVFSTKIVP